MKTGVTIALCSTLLTLSVTSTVNGAVVFLGPTPYLQQSDSPFAGSSFNYFYLEDFEDGAMNTPGLSATFGDILLPSTFTDSVDADDGSIDGSGREGTSWFASFGQSVPADITFSFDAGVLGLFPTHVGLAWTDSAGNGGFPAPAMVSLEVFGPSGNSLGVFGPTLLGDSSSTGQTAEDRFLGAIDPNGISAMRIFQSLRQIEVDHIQYGYQPVPIPPALWLFGSGLLGLIGIARRKKTA
jgi:hypothetical protein